MSYKVIDSRASRQPVPLGAVQEALATSQEAREMCAKAFGVPIEMMTPICTEYEEAIASNRRMLNWLYGMMI